jgi:cytochrome c-type biogenesis protein CcmE
MSRKLDDDLADAIASSAAQDEAPGLSKSVPEDKPRRAAKTSGNMGLLAVLLVMVGAVVALVMVGFNDAAVYAVDVQQVRTEGAAMVGRRLRVEGELVPGTLEKRDKPCEFRFVMHTGDARLPVRYPKCVIPDTFRDRPEGGVQVTVEGTLGSPDEFEASLVMAKCTSKYDPETHSLIPESKAAPAATDDEMIR